MTHQIIKVLIVDDHQLMIEGLRVLLEDEDCIKVVSGATSMTEALDFLKHYPVDIILMDINMPEASGIEITKNVKMLYPSVKIIALTMHEDISIISKMIKAGASGYILKRTNMQEVIDAIKTVHQNGRYLSSNVQNVIMDNLMSPIDLLDAAEEGKAVLSAREIEVLQLIAKEYNNEQIGEALYISERTVEAHRRNIFIKTKTKSIVGLIKYALNEGLVSLD
ncbi:response regulator [Epilithonimonas arachidiradicis]|uniref:DNA-binding response regulator n=1 Tax=Epilithonimonas arachidiradicis TaxID=1617282 RepID=A0A420D8S5_9FLAO|nr:response regulator transcription factor [Epilithonimonas arachidiradicis]RKE87133.1 LuxR family two component transcriptional regulator [Epilithonimonas arachidiradicis]GGG58495.1 DNA-binding response regulator [Epilithonimonas arachidiradicis]